MRIQEKNLCLQDLIYAWRIDVPEDLLDHVLRALRAVVGLVITCMLEVVFTYQSVKNAENYRNHQT